MIISDFIHEKMVTEGDRFHTIICKLINIVSSSCPWLFAVLFFLNIFI